MAASRPLFLWTLLLFIRFCSFTNASSGAAASLTLSFDSDAQSASEASAGGAGFGTVTIPSPNDTDILISLESSDPSEIAVPATVTISAGQTSATFPVTNFDDAIADGGALVAITASAGGFASARSFLVNRDDEVGHLYLVLPATTKENSGVQASPGIVFIDAPARHDVLIRLRSESIISVPDSVIIPAGASSATFSISAGNDDVFSADRVRIWAGTDNWPEAVATIGIEDNDSQTFTLVVPDVIWRGQENEGIVRFDTARPKDIQISFGVYQGAVILPDSVTLRAGEKEAHFSIGYAGSDFNARIFAQASDSLFVADQYVFPRSNIPNISSMAVSIPVYAAFAGDSVHVVASLVSAAGFAQYTNVTGELRVKGASMTVPFTPLPIQFTNGTWAGDIVLSGTAQAIYFEASAAEFTGQSWAFDLFTGGRLSMNVLDLAWYAKSNLFLVSKGPATNATGQLLAIAPSDPANPVATLSLTSPATSISISDDGSTAWLALNNGALQKVDLLQWTVAGTFPVSATNASYIARDVLILPGEQNKIVAVVGPPSLDASLVRVQLFSDGVPNTNVATVPISGVSGASLIRGRNSSEVFYQSAGRLAKYQVGDGIARIADISMPGYPVNTEFADGKLYNGSGNIIDPETLSVEHRYIFPPQFTTTIYPFPSINRVLVTYQDALVSCDLTTGAQLASHDIYSLYIAPNFTKAVAWPEGIAIGLTNALAIVKSPLIETTTPDLQLGFLGPQSHTNAVDGPFAWQFDVFNKGPGPAPYVTLRIEGVSDIAVGTLAEGEHRVVQGPTTNPPPSLLQANISVFCALDDPDISNNHTNIATEVKSGLVLREGAEITIAATALASTTNYDRIYAAFSALAGHPGAGLAVINPTTRAVERTFDSPGNVTKLSMSDDQFVYGITSSNQVTRWGIANGIVDQTITTADPILDMATLPDQPGLLLVATTTGVSAYQDAGQLSAIVNDASDFKCLGMAGSNPWLSEQGKLYRLSVATNGVSIAEGPIAVSFFTDNYRFVADSQRLYFDSYIFQIASRTVTPGVATSGFALFPEQNTLVSLLPNRAQSFKTSVTPLQLIADETIPFQPFGNVTRFNSSGVAGILQSGDIFLYTLSAVPNAGPATDLQLQLAPPPTPYSFYPVQWQFTVTNLSNVSAERVRLFIDRPDTLRDIVFEGAVPLTIYGTTAFDLGDMAAGETRNITLHGSSIGGNTPITARIVSNSPDSNTNNNAVSYNAYFSGPLADLQITSLTGPRVIPLNGEATYTFVAKNGGPTDLPEVYLALYMGDGIVTTNSYVGPFSLTNGENKSIDVKVTATLPGLVRISAQVSANWTDTAIGNETARQLVYVEDASASLSDLVLPITRLLTWSEARKEIIAAFEDTEWAVHGLDPKTLKPRWTIPVDANPEQIFPTDDGAYVWVAVGDGAVNRVNMQSGAVDLRFTIPHAQLPITALFSPPGRPDLVLVESNPGSPQIQLFQNTIAKGAPYQPAGNIAVTDSGKIFVGRFGSLREIAVTTSGIAEKGNLDFAAPVDDTSMWCLGEKLYFGDGHVVDTTAKTFQDAFADTLYLATDKTTQRITRLFRSNGIVPQAFAVESIDPSDNSVSWRTGVADLAGLLPVGTNGVLQLMPRLSLFDFDATGPGVDLRLATGVPTVVLAPDVPFGINVVVTNNGVWLPKNAMLTVDLPDDAAVFDGASWVQTNKYILPLDLQATPKTIQVRLSDVGPARIAFHASNDLPELNPADNDATNAIVVSPFPVMLIDNSAQPEGAGIVAWLSSPAPTDLDVAYVATPITTDAADLLAPTGSFHFSAGSTMAVASIVASDGTPELDETFRLDLVSTNIPLIRTQTVVTVLNDDPARLAVTSPTVTEGNIGSKTATVTFTINAAPFPAQVDYTTLSGTALADRDFVPQSGVIQFAPGETTKSIDLSILGNTVFEPTKTFSIALNNPINLKLIGPAPTISIRNDDPPPPFGMTIVRTSATRLQLRFEAAPNVSYFLESRTSIAPGAWASVPAAPTISGTNGQFSINAPVAAQTYYRVRGLN